MHVLFLTLLAAAIAFAGFGPAYAQISVPNAISVQSNDVTLKDVFQGADKNAVVAEAPLPGRRIVFDAYALNRLAKRHGLKWRPRTRFDQAVITRASRVVETKEIEDALRDSLGGQELPHGLHVQLTTKVNGVHVATGLPVAYRIENPSLDTRNGRITGDLVVLGGKSREARYRLDAITYEVVEVPVLSRRIRRGEVIGDHDVVWKKHRRDSLGRNIVQERKAIVGMAARRYLALNKPLLIDDLEAPKLVRKGSLVTIYLETPNLRLTAKARATEDGAANETIRVVNIRSRKVVEAIVRSPTKVVIPTDPSVTH